MILLVGPLRASTSRLIIFKKNFSKCYPSSHEKIIEKVLCYRQFSTKQPDPPVKDNKEELKIDLDAINKRVEEDLKKATAGEETELDKTFINFSARRSTKNDVSLGTFSALFTWKYYAIFSAICGSMLVILFISWKYRTDEREKNRKKAIGKAKIGGDWELLNMEGKPEGSKDLRGKWQLIYFGFTNCPDICPDEIEKMMDVIDILHREQKGIPIVPIFISVDPVRDTVERVKKYCSEFSPKLRGFTGTKEQVHQVTKAYRIYYSEGPKSEKNKDDYIVDHSVLMYLIDPDGQFHDYYGQNRRAQEIAKVIKEKISIWDLKRKREQSFLGQILKRKEEVHTKEENAQKIPVSVV